MAGKQRQKREPKHIRLYASITSSEAWRHLSGNAVKVLLALVARDDGTRNGALGFSCREAADVTALGERTCWRCLIELQEKGFIVCTHKGGFNRKVLHSSLWRYTWAPWPGGRPAAPTRDFEKWRCMEIRGCKICNRTVVVSDESSGNFAPPVAEFTTDEMETPDVSVSFHPANNATLIIHQGDSAANPETGRRKQANSSSGAISAFSLGDPLSDLRERAVQHIGSGGAGSQSRLATRIGCPPGTFSKFLNGRNLPAEYRAALDEAIGVPRRAA